MLGGSVADTVAAKRNPYSMEATRWQARKLAAGLRVHVSDASPRGFFGCVTSVHAGVVTVVRDDTGGRALVDLARRRVSVVDR